MAFKLLLTISFFILALLCPANAFPRNDSFHYQTYGSPGLKIRQDSLDSPCFAPCDPATCGNEAFCSPYNPSQEYNDQFSSGSHSINRSWAPESDRYDLLKRGFNQGGGKRWTIGRANAYLPGQVKYINGKFVGKDNQFPTNAGFTFGKTDSRTVAYQKRFGNEVFQYGTGGLHGCTMFCIVSRRAVYISHFWETFTTNNNDNLEGEDFQIWQNRVLNTLTGAPTPDPFQGPAAGVDWTLFNRADDQTLVCFMTPLNYGETPDINSTGVLDFTRLKYPNKLGTIDALVRHRLPRANVTMKAYERLYYSFDGATGKYTGDPDQLRLIDTTARGIAVFQYDGSNNWRLFYEEALFQGTT